MDQPASVLQRLFLVIVPQELFFPSSHSAVTKPLPSRNTKTNTPRTLSMASRDGKILVFHWKSWSQTPNLSHLQFLWLYLVVWAKPDHVLGKMSSWLDPHKCQDSLWCSKERGKHMENNPLAFPKLNFTLFLSKRWGRGVRIQSEALAIICCSFYSPWKATAGKELLKIPSSLVLLEIWGCGRRKVKLILISWFPRVHQAQECCITPVFFLSALGHKIFAGMGEGFPFVMGSFNFKNNLNSQWTAGFQFAGGNIHRLEDLLSKTPTRKAPAAKAPCAEDF